jgi:hypothetical protein
MPDFQQGKIYKIVSGNLVYIGSTTQTLKARLTGHIGDYKRRGQKTCTSYLLIESGQYEISLIESYPCQSKTELSTRERFWIETTTCVNKIIPGRTQQEWNEAHQEQLNEYKKEYGKHYNEKRRDQRQENGDELRQRDNEYYRQNCEVKKARQRAYNEKNREKQKEYARLYRERKSNVSP